jgi:hypothetical protein
MLAESGYEKKEAQKKSNKKFKECIWSTLSYIFCLYLEKYYKIIAGSRKSLGKRNKKANDSIKKIIFLTIVCNMFAPF